MFLFLVFFSLQRLTKSYLGSFSMQPRLVPAVAAASLCSLSSGAFYIPATPIFMTTPNHGPMLTGGELGMGDKLILRGLMFHGFHGVKLEEQKLGQKFLIDVDAWLDLRKAGKSDCLSDTISYTDIYRLVKEVVEGPPHSLLESVAEVIASSTLTRYPQISAVRVKVGKPHVAVHGPLDYLGVEILRCRQTDVRT